MGKTYKDFKYAETDYRARKQRIEDRKRARSFKKQMKKMEKEDGQR